MNQIGLFDRRAPFAAGSDTSKAAAAAIEPAAKTYRAVVLAYLRGRGVHGATCDEVEQAIGLIHQTASARIRELAQAGLIFEAGKRATRTGRAAVVWCSKP